MSDRLDLAPPESCAVLIGVSDYSDKHFPNLPAVDNSLRDIRQMLTDPGLCGWRPEQVITIADPEEAGQTATRLHELACATSGVLLFYYAGHGVLTQHGQLSLTVSGTRNAAVDFTALPFDWIRRALEASPARVRIVVLDCCFAGRALGPRDREASFASATAMAGTYVLTATTGYKTAHVAAPEHQTSVSTSFTAALVDVVRSGIPGGPATLTLDDLFPELRRRLRAQGLPQPSQRNNNNAGIFAFTRNAHTTTHQTAEPAVTTAAPALRVGRRAVVAATVTLLAGSGTATGILLRDSPQSALRATLKGGTDDVRTVAFSRDGAALAGAGQDGKVRLWNAGTQDNIATLTGHEKDVLTVTFSPDGSLLASGSEDATVRIWDLRRRGTEVTVLRHPGTVFELAFTADGRLLASAGQNDVRLWDVKTHKLAAVLASNLSGTALAMRSDGRMLATSGSEPGSIHLWNPATARSQATIDVPAGAVQILTFSPDAKLLVSGSWDETALRLWTVTDRKAAGVLTGLAEIVTSVAFSPDGRTLASSAGGNRRSDDAIHLWDLARRNVKGTLTANGGDIAELSFSPDGKTLASAGDAVRLWRVSA
ncbi:caspase family protein [Streptomyces sp. NPDC008092]|uniref:caspase, EACC1-associated type n=1 Tax=Streptomyces sp. NPDC008092 TaxID=3364808 RepID=UPI0036EEF17E